MPGPRMAPAGRPSLQLRGQGRSKSTMLLKCVSCMTMEPKGHSPPTSAPVCSGQGPARALGVCDLGPSAEHRQEPPPPGIDNMSPTYMLRPVSVLRPHGVRGCGQQPVINTVRAAGLQCCV